MYVHLLICLVTPLFRFRTFRPLFCSGPPAGGAQTKIRLLICLSTLICLSLSGMWGEDKLQRGGWVWTRASQKRIRLFRQGRYVFRSALGLRKGCGGGGGVKCGECVGGRGCCMDVVLWWRMVGCVWLGRWGDEVRVWGGRVNICNVFLIVASLVISFVMISPMLIFWF